MLGTKAGASGIEAFRALADAGITLNCQIVCCPGINDGRELVKTLKGLLELGPCINSVAVVPVGLTKHREGLAAIRPVGRGLALKIVRQVGHFGERCLRLRGARVFYCADELYMKAGLRLPPHEFYEDYPQLENGVGMMRLFITEFEEACAWIAASPAAPRNDVGPEGSTFSIATGVAAFKYLTNLLKTSSEKCDRIMGSVYCVRNEFFGESVTVSGLVTGGDLISQLRGCDLGSRLLIPQNMLRHGDDVFLDDVTVSDVSRALGVPVRVVRQDGADLVRAIMEGNDG